MVLWFLISAFMIAMSTTSQAFSANTKVLNIERQACNKLYEPSGVTQLLDGKILVVEDEKYNPISLYSLKKDEIKFVRSLKTSPFFAVFSGRSNLGVLADLEAVDLGKDGFIYAITSHSRTQKSKRLGEREKFMRFKVEDNQITHVSVVSDLKSKMVQLDKRLKVASKASYAKEGGNGFNIEGLSFDKNKQTLLIGLRSPVIDKKAVLLVLKNPKAVFDQGASPHFKKSLIYLDLDKGGIRSITFDPYLNGYLIISRHEKKGKKFKLWWWSGQESQSPRRVHIDGKLDFSNAEGITSVRYRGGDKLMVVFDMGNSFKRKKGCYAFISYSQLKVEGGTQP